MASGISPEAWIANAPIKVRLAGWVSDTYTLQREGWQLSAAQRFDNMTLQIAMHLPGNTYCITNVVDLQYFRTGQDRVEMLRHLELNVPHSSASIVLRTGDTYDERGHMRKTWNEPIRAAYATFQPIDATPFSRDLEKGHKLEDMVIFRPLATSEIIVAPDTVPGLMDKILELQDPSMKKLIVEQRIRSARSGQPTDAPRVENHCQIISIAS